MGLPLSKDRFTPIPTNANSDDTALMAPQPATAATGGVDLENQRPNSATVPNSAKLNGNPGSKPKIKPKQRADPPEVAAIRRAVQSPNGMRLIGSFCQTTIYYHGQSREEQIDFTTCNCAPAIFVQHLHTLYNLSSDHLSELHYWDYVKKILLPMPSDDPVFYHGKVMYLIDKGMRPRIRPSATTTPSSSAKPSNSASNVSPTSPQAGAALSVAVNVGLNAASHASKQMTAPDSKSATALNSSAPSQTKFWIYEDEQWNVYLCTDRPGDWLGRCVLKTKYPMKITETDMFPADMQATSARGFAIANYLAKVCTQLYGMASADLVTRFNSPSGWEDMSRSLDAPKNTQLYHTISLYPRYINPIQKYGRVWIDRMWGTLPNLAYDGKEMSDRQSVEIKKEFCTALQSVLQAAKEKVPGITNLWASHKWQTTPTPPIKPSLNGTAATNLTPNPIPPLPVATSPPSASSSSAVVHHASVSAVPVPALPPPPADARVVAVTASGMSPAAAMAAHQAAQSSILHHPGTYKQPPTARSAGDGM